MDVTSIRDQAALDVMRQVQAGGDDKDWQLVRDYQKDVLKKLESVPALQYLAAHDFVDIEIKKAAMDGNLLANQIISGGQEGGGKNKELHDLNMKINHVAKMLEIGGTKAHVPRDLTEIEKDKRTLNGLPEGRQLTEYEVSSGKLLVNNVFSLELFRQKEAELETLREQRDKMKEDSPPQYKPKSDPYQTQDHRRLDPIKPKIIPRIILDHTGSYSDHTQDHTGSYRIILRIILDHTGSYQIILRIIPGSYPRSYPQKR